MKKDKNYTPPTSIVVNGEKVNFHYNREERLAMSNNYPKDNKKRNGYLKIIVFDLVLIVIIGIMLSFFYGKNKTVTYNELEVSFSHKRISKSRIIDFTIRINNETEKALKIPELKIDVYNKTLSKNIINKDIKTSDFIEKNDIYIDHYLLKNIQKGDYTVQLIIDKKETLTLEFTISD